MNMKLLFAKYGPGLLTAALVSTLVGGAAFAAAIDEYGVATMDDSAQVMESAGDVIPAFNISPQAYGVDSYSSISISGMEFHGLRDAEPGDSAAGGLYWNGGTSGFFDAGFHLPTGSLFYGVTYLLYDNSDTGQVDFWIWDRQYTAGGGTGSTLIYDYEGTGVAATPGETGKYVAFDSPVLIVNGNALLDAEQEQHFYSIRASFSQTGVGLGLRGLVLWYKRQVSPAPASATFDDVATDHQFFQYIEALAASGITSGCSATSYCPDAPLTRGQMAVFLAKALGLHYGY
ncbi:S-layer homology domain-containing protein [Thiolapillus sp.]